MHHSGNRRCTALFLTASALFTSTLPGETNAPPLTVLPPIVVVGSRIGHRAEELPQSVTVITSEQIKASGASDTVQAMEKVGGVYFRKLSGNPAQSEMVMRGFSQNAHGRVLVLVDGQRLNDPDMTSPNWTRIPVASIERIEILRGGQTALYGNYAVAGVVNIITKKGDEPLTSLSVTAGSEDTYGTHLHRSGPLGDDFRYAADLDWQKSQGWRANSAYQTYDARVRLEQDWTKRFSSTLGAFYNWNEYGMPGALTKEQMRSDPQQSLTLQDNARQQTWGFNLGSTGETLDWGDVSLNIIGQRRLRSSEMVSWGSEGYTAINSMALNPKYQLEHELRGHRNIFTLGADIGAEELDYRLTPLSPWVMSADADLKRLFGALYLRDEFFLLETLSLAFTARGEGMRTAIDGVSAGTPLDGSTTDWQYALDVALLYRPAKGQKYYLRGSTLYRYPFLDEVGSYQGWGPGFNEDLQPEKGWQLEAGLSLDLFDQVTYDLNVYHLSLRDEIAWSGMQNENLDQTCRNGLETGLTWSLPAWGTLGLNYQLIDAEFADGANKGNEIPLVPTHVVTLNGEAKVAYGVSLLGTLRAVSSQYLGDDNGNVAERLEGYMTLDVGARYEPPFLKGFSLLCGCDNVFDTNYATAGFWGWGWGDRFYPANGRTWKLSASYQF